MIKATEITKSYGNLQVLKGISLEVAAGEVVSVVGPSGAGKTTLLQILGTLSRQDAGDITMNGIRTDQLTGSKLARFRNMHIGFVFQFHQLLPEFNAHENVCIPGFIANRPRKEVEEQARELLDFLGLEDRLDHKPSELSGGEQQRVAVARALINDPEVILADEPSGNLDTENKQELHKLFMTLRDKFQKTLVIVTHDHGLAEMADRIITMKDGRII
ncbi:MAG: lipoprotein-releasing system ATP-binding protein LolD [Bacteroidetes bacterium]|nr:MAG: lipoprotein-releasing system ATP-binding protein LolD [Bacteroidota bacterium]RLD72283.1 MAG: lipoprotein-releasing system ATP-binding protein LolD [Bacteroidota bacterium]RLD96289.1 MAG: lipoprotein-releasing system ATP-binding protein LolD [Bacteroidota bacterium]